VEYSWEGRQDNGVALARTPPVLSSVPVLGASFTVSSSLAYVYAHSRSGALETDNLTLLEERSRPSLIYCIGQSGRIPAPIHFLLLLDAYYLPITVL
jgi:hypothetical protein